jgi:DNA polymerase III epsilon subunit-like protein
MTKLCFIDTETTSLRHDRRAWEIAVITREPGKPQREDSWFVAAQDLDLGNADLMSLKIGGFLDRHPGYRSPEIPPKVPDGDLRGEHGVLRQVEDITRGAHLVGAVPSFDAEVLGNRMRANGICPSWHYHLIDIEALAVGYLHGRVHGEEADGGWANALADVGLPWKSDQLSAALGVGVSDEDRHTALGDARWAMRVWDAVTGGRP